MQLVFNKLFNKRSTPVKQALKSKREVKLSKVNDLMEQANSSFYTYEQGIEIFDEATSKITEARDNLRYSNYHPSDLQDELDEIKAGLDDLGIDYPSEIDDAQVSIDDAISSHNDLHDRFSGWGIDPMNERI